MDKHQEALQAANPSRRVFLKKAGAGLGFAVVLGTTGVSVNKLVAGQPTQRMLGPWVTISTNGDILILNPAAEMGQGSMTGLPLIIAEEMDADWARVRIEHAPIEPDVYGRSWRPGGPGTMMTVGSQAIRGYFSKLRKAGAQIRHTLLQEAASHWQVSVNELTTEPSLVIHASSGREMTYGEIAAIAQGSANLSADAEVTLKSPDEFRLIGHSMPRHDVPAKTDGSALFAMDVQVPDMVYAMVVRSPVHNGRPVSYNAEAVEALQGIESTVSLDYGVGIIGTTIEAVIAARKTLAVEWAGGEARGLDSQQKLRQYAEAADDENLPARSVVDEGDARTAITSAIKTYEADFYSDHVYHAQMEPLCAVVSVDDASAEVWVGTQNTAGARQAVAEELEIPFEQVTLHPCYLGGGFGRRSTSDYLIEAVKLAQAAQKPVKLIWTREDDLRYGMYRPMNLQRMRAGVNEAGDIVGWTHCVVGDGGGLLTSGVRNEFYDLPNQLIELCSIGTGVRLKHWRAVGHGFNKYAIEAFIDEIAADLAIDPYEYRRRLMRNTPRALAVIDAVAKMADWRAFASEDSALGMAFGERSGALAAGVAEVSVDADSGKIKVHNFWCAVDGGIIIQPDNATAQIEGGVVTGLSSVLYERITLKDGVVEQSNFHDYPLLRMADMPEILVEFIDSQEKPEGMGEASTPLVAAAVANAFAALTGKRLYHLPFTADRVKAVLG